MPRPAVGLIHPQLGKHAVCSTTLITARKLDDRRANQRMAERRSVKSRRSCRMRFG
jgi:hypothetical protein